MSNLNLPHNFSKLRTGNRPPFLIVGAGLSFGLVPLPHQLLQQYRSDAEAELDCRPNIQGDPTLYVWAEEVLKLLQGRGEPIPKLRLAEVLGLLRDDRWLGTANLLIRGTMPRHRVMARFAREERWAGLWSLNWDCYLESALEQVGLTCGEPQVNQPWRTAYKTVVTSDEFSEADRRDLVCILKPHGCIRALVKARELVAADKMAEARILADRFLLTESELQTERKSPTDKRFFARLRSLLASSPMMVVGWSISEPYLQGVINDTIKDVVTSNTVEELTVVDINFNDKGHAKAADCYQLTRENVFAEVEAGDDATDINQFFLWLQGNYAIDHIKAFSPPETLEALNAWASAISTPESSSLVIDFADWFLPAWVRLCWRSGLVTCYGFQPHQLRLELEDEHIPWHLPRVPRDDLRAAGILLDKLSKNDNKWDLGLFPGALWDKGSNRLVLPLPAWGPLNDLAAIGPLMNALERNKGFVVQLDILPMENQVSTVLPSVETIDRLKQSIANVVGIPKFTDVTQIGVATDILFPQGPGHD